VLQTDKVVLQMSNIASLMNKKISPICNIVHSINKAVLLTDIAMLLTFLAAFSGFVAVL
jgi:hypothetical protein